MKRVPLALAFLAVAGAASAAMLSPPPALTLEHKPLAAKSSASVAIETARAPVPLPNMPKPPPIDIAALAEVPPTVQIAPTPPAQADRASQPGTAKEVRTLSESRCGGRPMKSIAVMPDGSVHVQC